MNRQDTDLLDLFRGPGGGAPRRAARSEKPRAGGARATAISLDRRRAVLAAAAAVLVVVLAFVAGVGIGRAKSRATDTPMAARLAQGRGIEGATWSLVSAPIPPVGLSGEPLPQKVYDELIKKWPAFAERVRATTPASPFDAPARDSGHRCLVITGFSDWNSAQNVQYQLAVFAVVGAGCPFQSSVPEREH